MNAMLKPTGERSIDVIAREIEADWSKLGKGVNYAAKPYLDAMKTMSTMDAPYFCDSGVSVVLYFLGNATSWRGEKAKAIKAELKAMLKARGC
jgi:hypothetical protein